MPAIVTLNSIIRCSGRIAEDSEVGDINNIVSDIAFNILMEAPQLVADVAAGSAEHEALERAVIRDMDKNYYHMGLYRQKLIKKVFDYMFGYGALQEYVDDDDISDIDGTKFNEFVIKRKGMREPVPISFESNKAYEIYCKLIVREKRRTAERKRQPLQGY